MTIKFFIDENISPNIAKALKILGENVEYVTDKFAKGTDDLILLEYVGNNDIALITKDERIRYNPSERAALHKFGVLAFFIGGQNNRCGSIQQIIKSWPEMKNVAKKELGKGFRAYLIRKSGGKPKKIIFK